MQPFIGGAALAQWTRLCLPSCLPRFKSQAHHLHFYHYSQFVLYFSCEKNQIKQKEAGFKKPFQHDHCCLIYQNKLKSISKYVIQITKNFFAGYYSIMSWVHRTSMVGCLDCHNWKVNGLITNKACLKRNSMYRKLQFVNLKWPKLSWMKLCSRPWVLIDHYFSYMGECP